MRLLDFPAAPNPRRFRIFVAEKGIELPVEVVDVPAGENRTEAFLARNPVGTLPVLELDDGRWLSESVAICRYLESRYPDPPLMGVGSEEQAIVEMWNRRMELELFRHSGDYFRHTAAFFAGRYAQSPEIGRDAARLAVEAMAWLDRELAGRSFVAGDRLTIADITGWVAIDLGVPSAFEIPPECGNVARWFDELAGRPAFRT